MVLVGILAGGTLKADDLAPVIGSLVNNRDKLDSVSFAEVVEASTGHRVIPVDQEDEFIRGQLLPAMVAVMDRVLAVMNEASSPAQARGRINEVSGDFEKAIRKQLDALDGFRCQFATKADGGTQRSGYPDLLLIHDSGRRLYLDPKVFASKSRHSSFRTFYYEPKRETNKITSDAHHLVVGIEHEGKIDGLWRFVSWELVDFSGMKVRLKAEFQSSNREMYRSGSLIKGTPKTESETQREGRPVEK